MRSRIVVKFWVVKMSMSSRFVTSNVFEGGEGVIRGGRSERSSDMGVPDDRLDAKDAGRDV